MMEIRHQSYHIGTILWFTAIVLGVCSVFSVRGCRKQFSVKSVGFHPVRKGDTALVLYADIFNGGNVTLHLEIVTEKCCLFLPGEILCKGMTLIGQNQGDVKAKNSVKFTFVYPTTYPYDRKGECNLLVLANTSCDTTMITEATIPFNTQIQRDWWTDWFPHSLQTVLFGAGVRDCKGVDEDRLRLCRPVNCRLKYGGARNFYNSTERKCLAVPKCASQLYDPVNNECRNPSKHLGKEMYRRVINKSSLRVKSEKSKDPDWRTLVGPRLDCGHGQLSPDNTECKCDPDWTTHPPQQAVKQGEVTRMCNIQNKVPGKSVMNIIITFLCSVLVLMLAVVLCLYVRARIQAQYVNKPGSWSTDEKETFFSTLHKNWKPIAGDSKETSWMMGMTGNYNSSSVAAEDDSQDEI
ncbi:uncharacterized protein [Argopecten irradians]